GHYTQGGGFVIDATQSMAVRAGTELEIVAQGNVVGVYVNDCEVLTRTYGTSVTGGKFGLLSWTGTNVFACVNLTTNDPGLKGQSDLPEVTGLSSGEPSIPGPTWNYQTGFT